MTKTALNRKPGNPFSPSPFDAALANHDRAITLMDAKWGVNVLPDLVSPETAAKFARSTSKRDLSIETGDDDAAIAAFGSVVRGLAALDAEATAAGHVPLKVDRVWVSRAVDGNPVAIVQSNTDARIAHASKRFEGYLIYSLEEIMLIISDRSLLGVLDAKKLFPGATIEKVKPAVVWKQGDDLPF